MIGVKNLVGGQCLVDYGAVINIKAPIGWISSGHVASKELTIYQSSASGGIYCQKRPWRY